MTTKKLSNAMVGCKHIQLSTIDPTDLCKQLGEPRVLPLRWIKTINYVLFLSLTVVRSVYRREKSAFS